MTIQAHAPWTADEAASLNAYQESGVFHPFTCPVDSNDLYAEAGGSWRCPACDYRQEWAHGWMADWRWQKAVAP